MTTELATINQDQITAIVQSGIGPKEWRDPTKAIVMAMGARDLGLTPSQAMTSMFVIDGKVGLSATTIQAVCERAGCCEYFMMIESTDKIATYETKHTAHPAPVRMSFTLAMAERAGLASRGPWRQYPEAMLRARAISQLARCVFPGLISGMYEADELREIAASEAPSVLGTVKRAAAAHAVLVAHEPAAEEPQAVVAEPADNSRTDAMIANMRSAMSAVELVELGKTARSMPEFRAPRGPRRAEMIRAYEARKAELDHEAQERAAITGSETYAQACAHPVVQAESKACQQECE